MTQTPLESLHQTLFLALDPLLIELCLLLCRAGVGPLPLVQLLLFVMAMAAALGLVLANDSREGLKGLFVTLCCIWHHGDDK